VLSQTFNNNIITIVAAPDLTSPHPAIADRDASLIPTYIGRSPFLDKAGTTRVNSRRIVVFGGLRALCRTWLSWLLQR
jgi:hypothetical protein